MLGRVRPFAIPWTAARQASLSITNCWSLPKPMSIESVMPSNHLILCHPLLLPSIFPSIRVFSKWVSSLQHVARVLEFQLQHQSFQWTPRTDLNYSIKSCSLSHMYTYSWFMLCMAETKAICKAIIFKLKINKLNKKTCNLLVTDNFIKYY